MKRILFTYILISFAIPSIGKEPIERRASEYDSLYKAGVRIKRYELLKYREDTVRSYMATVDSIYSTDSGLTVFSMRLNSFMKKPYPDTPSKQILFINRQGKPVADVPAGKRTKFNFTDLRCLYDEKDRLITILEFSSGDSLKEKTEFEYFDDTKYSLVKRYDHDDSKVSMTRYTYNKDSLLIREEYSNDGGKEWTVANEYEFDESRKLRNKKEYFLGTLRKQFDYQYSNSYFGLKTTTFEQSQRESVLGIDYTIRKRTEESFDKDGKIQEFLKYSGNELALISLYHYNDIGKVSEAIHYSNELAYDGCVVSHGWTATRYIYDSNGRVQKILKGEGPFATCEEYSYNDHGDMSERLIYSKGKLVEKRKYTYTYAK